jgi:hypothetical protein
MNGFGQKNWAQTALQWFVHPIRSIRKLLFTECNGQQRVLEETVDATVIGQEGSIDTVVAEPAYFADCGHYLKGNLGGRCSCGAIVCRVCLRRCSACGAPLCPPCSITDPGTSLVLCLPCADELAYRRRASLLGRSIATLFLDEQGEAKP